MIWPVRYGVLPLQLADPVEDHDRVVDREADQRQERGDHRQVDLEWLQEAATWLTPGIIRQPVGDGHRAQGDQHVVDDRDDRRQAVDQRLEAEPEVQGDDQPARDGRDDGQGLGLVRPPCCRRSRTARRGGCGPSSGPEASLSSWALATSGSRLVRSVRTFESRHRGRKPGVALGLMISKGASGSAGLRLAEDVPERESVIREADWGRLNFSSYCATAGEAGVDRRPRLVLLVLGGVVGLGGLGRGDRPSAGRPGQLDELERRAERGEHDVLDLVDLLLGRADVVAVARLVAADAEALDGHVGQVVGPARRLLADERCSAASR